jgi:hypothetical protein
MKRMYGIAVFATLALVLWVASNGNVGTVVFVTTLAVFATVMAKICAPVHATDGARIPLTALVEYNRYDCELVLQLCETPIATAPMHTPAMGDPRYDRDRFRRF